MTDFLSKLSNDLASAPVSAIVAKSQSTQSTQSSAPIPTFRDGATLTETLHALEHAIKASSSELIFSALEQVKLIAMQQPEQIHIMSDDQLALVIQGTQHPSIATRSTAALKNQVDSENNLFALASKGIL